MRDNRNIKGIEMPREIQSLTLADARSLIAAGEKRANELGVPYNLAVVDAGGGLIAHVRMDGAWLGSVDISIHKAWTARAFDMATEDLAKVGDTVVGALGASGGTVDQDVQVANAAIAALGVKKSSGTKK
jgi:uncharacterized protein GlcG (DUF336 family)